MSSITRLPDLIYQAKQDIAKQAGKNVVVYINPHDWHHWSSAMMLGENAKRNLWDADIELVDIPRGSFIIGTRVHLSVTN